MFCISGQSGMVCRTVVWYAAQWYRMPHSSGIVCRTVVWYAAQLRHIIRMPHDTPGGNLRTVWCSHLYPHGLHIFAHSVTYVHNPM